MSDLAHDVETKRLVEPSRFLAALVPCTAGCRDDLAHRAKEHVGQDASSLVSAARVVTPSIVPHRPMAKRTPDATKHTPETAMQTIGVLNQYRSASRR